MSSGGPPHHSHNRQVPNANAAAAWNHLQAQLQVPNYFPRQPQAAHTHPVTTERNIQHPLHQHQPTWHTPTTTEAMKILPNIQHTHMLNEMLKNEALFRAREGVDLSLARNGNQNGELSTTPISLSVRDTNKINSLTGLDIQAVNSPGIKSTISPSLTITPSVTLSPGGLKSVSPGLKSASPGLKSGSPGLKTGSPSHKSHSPAPKSGSPSLGVNMGGLLSMGAIPSIPSALGMPLDPSKNQKRSNIRVDSILERLNPVPDKALSSQDHKHEHPGLTVRPDLHSMSVTRTEIPNKPSEVHQYAMAMKQAEMLANLQTSLQSGLGAESLTNPAALANMQRLLEMAMAKNAIPDLSQVLRNDVTHSKHDNVTRETPSTTNVPVVSSLVPKEQDVVARERTNVDKKETEKECVREEKKQQSGEKIAQSGVIVQPASSYDENSNSSSIANVPTPVKEEDSGSMHSNEDSLDSMKSRRKRKPIKTVKVLSKEDEIREEQEKACSNSSSSHNLATPVNERTSVSSILGGKASILVPPFSKIPERRRSSDDLDMLISPKTRRKTSSESETIDNIAAMVHEGLQDKCAKGEFFKETKKAVKVESPKLSLPVTSTLATQPKESQPVTVSVIKTKDNLVRTLTDGAASKDEVDGVKKGFVDSPKNDHAEVIKQMARETSRASPVMTPAQKKATNTHFVEVENKLEEMFAGIVGESTAQPGTSTMNGESLKSDLLDLDVITTKSEALHESIKPEEGSDSEKKEGKSLPKKIKRNRTRSRQSNEEVESGGSRAKKGRFSKGKTTTGGTTKATKPMPVSTSPSSASKFKKLPSQGTSASFSSTSKVSVKVSETVKDVYAYDSGSNASSGRSRGPFVQIKGHRDSPVSVSIVNTPLGLDEDGDKKVFKNKKFHDDSEYRHKVRSKGLHCSTLSNKYDAQTKDATWICAFCKRGPHASELTGPSVVSETSAPAQGDLFGPYFITARCPEFERRLDDPFDRQFKSKKISKALDGGLAAGPALNKSKNKSKRKHSESSLDPSDVLLGISNTGQETYEVWAHEDCLVWSQGVYLVGPKIVGLEEAVWSCCNVSCTICSLKGANVSCIKRGCLNLTHLCCARGNGWRFLEDQFKAYCPQHSVQ